jgi:hypothetical protein
MIANFVVDKMSGYISGGMKPETAACFTYREMSAIYRGRRWSKNTAGTMRPTPPPENITMEEAGVKCRAAINEILKYCAENIKKVETYSTQVNAPKSASGAEKKSGLEGLKNYVKR